MVTPPPTAMDTGPTMSYSTYSSDKMTFDDSDDDDSDAPVGRPRRSIKTRVLLFMTRVQNTSALVFSTFLLAHLSSPYLAIVKGLDGANRWLILGRAWYLPLEPVVVWGALGLHLVSGLSKRLLSIRLKRPSPDDGLAFRDPEADLKRKRGLSRPLRVSWSLHAMTGYLLIPLISHHAWTTRVVPRQLDMTHLVEYSMVSYGLRKRPYAYVQIPLYTLLISALFFHVSGGLRKILSGGRKSATIGVERFRVGLAAVLGGGGLLGLGLTRIVLDGAKETPTWLLKKYEQVYLKAWTG